jgi:hypothetical protein
VGHDHKQLVGFSGTRIGAILTDARQWALHYAREARRWRKENAEWLAEFGTLDANYTRVEREYVWLALAWKRIADAQRGIDGPVA